MSDQRTALVLGGGGITGIAWEIGVLAGLAEAGRRPERRRPRRRHLGRLGGRRPADQRRRPRGAVRPPARAADGGAGGAAGPRRRWPGSPGRCCAPAATTPAFRRRIGALALAAEKAGLTPSEQERLDVIGARLVSTEWPERPLRRHRRRRGDRRVPHRSTATPACPWCRRSRPAARCPASTRRSPSTGAGTSTAACARRPTPTSRRATTGSSSSPRSRGVSGRWPASTRRSPAWWRGSPSSRPDAASKAAIGRNVLDPAARAPSARGRPGAGRASSTQVAEVWNG